MITVIIWETGVFSEDDRYFIDDTYSHPDRQVNKYMYEIVPLLRYKACNIVLSDCDHADGR